MEAFKGVAPSRTATGPLKNDSEVGTGRSDIDKLTNAVDGAWFESSVADPNRLAAFSMVGIPAATQNPSIGKPSRRISCQSGSYNENWHRLI